MVCMHSGQGCAITTRLLLPRSRYDEGVEMVKAAFESFPYGDPTDFNNMAGPLINARQRERVLGLIEKGKAEGAKCLVGGGAATQFDKGYFVQPTLFVDVDPDSTIAQQEIFGPVLVGDPVRGRRRRGAHREQLALRPVGRGRTAARSIARSASPAGSAPARSRSTAASGSGPTRRSAATRRAARAASTASPASRSTSRPRRSACPPPDSPAPPRGARIPHVAFAATRVSPR